MSLPHGFPRRRVGCQSPGTASILTATTDGTNATPHPQPLMIKHDRGIEPYVLVLATTISHVIIQNNSTFFFFFRRSELQVLVLVLVLVYKVIRTQFDDRFFFAFFILLYLY